MRILKPTPNPSLLGRGNIRNITIIGGTRGFGKWLASYIINSFRDEVEVTITGRNSEIGEKVAKDIGAKFSNDNVSCVENADIVIFAVPISIMVNTIKHLAPKLKPTSIVLDVTSIKKAPSDALNKYSPEGVLVIPTHPMFGPYISSISGQIFVLTASEKSKQDKRYLFLKNFLNKAGAKVIESTIVEHDKMMAIVQGLTHLTMFSLGGVIEKLGVDIKKSLDFVSPIYKILISSVARYMSHNPGLYADIQMNNDEVLKVHETFKEVLGEFNTIVETKDKQAFIDKANSISKHFGDNAKVGQTYTDKIIYLIGHEIDKLKDSIGSEIILENIYSQKKELGVIKKYMDDIIYFEDGREFDINEYKVI